MQTGYRLSQIIPTLYTIYGKTFEGENIRGFHDYAANCGCFPLKYFVRNKLYNYYILLHFVGLHSQNSGFASSNI